MTIHQSGSLEAKTARVWCETCEIRFERLRTDRSVPTDQYPAKLAILQNSNDYLGPKKGEVPPMKDIAEKHEQITHGAHKIIFTFGD